MKNKEATDGVTHNRPCFFAFSDSKHPEIYWIIPISSKYEKFKKIWSLQYHTFRYSIRKKYSISNSEYVSGNYLTAYIDKNDKPIRIDNRIASDVIRNAKEVLGIAKRGAKVVFPDIFTI